MSIPKISQKIIRSYASSKSWQRGQAYYHDGHVRRVVQRGKLITAEVEGSDIRPYQVNIGFEEDELDAGYCTCPYDHGGYCKHIVATLLVCLHEPELIEQRPSLEEILDRLNEVQTQTLIQDLVANNPQLLDDIEYFVDRVAPLYVITSSPETLPQRQITVDANRLRSKVRYILRDAVRYIEEGWDEEDGTGEIFSLIQDAQMYTQRGDSWNAIAMLTAITESCIENWDLVDEYGIENEEIAYELNTVWCETILSTDIAKAEKVDLDVNFEFWQNEWGSCFDMARAALQQGWDYPPLQQILEGNLNSTSLWEGLPPDYAEDLALIRLQILERQKRHEEYLYLAQATGLLTKYLIMLVRLEQVDLAMEAARSQMTTMEQALAFASVLVDEQNAQIEALEIAGIGLSLPGSCHYRLSIFTSEMALEVGDDVLATKAKVAAFKTQPNFADYRKIEKLAGDTWLTIKEELLEALATYDSWGQEKVKVDIYLYERLVEQAIATLDNSYYPSRELTQRVMDAAIEINPDWVIRNACRRAESIMDAGKAKYYDEAIEWLKKAHDAYVASDKQQEWSDYRTELMTIHGRKRKLMGLIKSEI